MKEWARVRSSRRCGLCRRAIAAGDPMLALWIVGHSWRKIRCVDCAGEPAPTDLPPLVAPPPTTQMTPIGALTSVSTLARQVRDGKLASVGVEREPGEDDV